MDKQRQETGEQPEPGRRFTLPPINIPAMSDSLMAMEAKQHRTIENEFGKIVIDSRGIEVVPSPRLSLEPEPYEQQPLTTNIAMGGADGGGRSSRSRVFSRMFLLNSSTASSRCLAMAVEREQRIQRGVWRSDAELLLVICSALIGMGAFLGFPYKLLLLGGGAFLLAFVLFQVLVGLPLLMLEAMLGQFAAHGQAALMRQMVPALKGYTHAIILGMGLITVTYMSTISSVMIYAVDAMRQPQPWLSCNQSHNSDLCFTLALDRQCQLKGGALYFAKRCVNIEEICGRHRSTSNLTINNETSTTPDTHGTKSTVDPLKQPSLKDFGSGCVPLGNGSFMLNLTGTPQRHLASAEYYDSMASNTDHTIRSQILHAPSLLSLLACWLFNALVSHRGFDGLPITLPLMLVLPFLLTLAVTINFLVLHGTQTEMWSVFASDFTFLKTSGCWVEAAFTSLYSMAIGTGLTAEIYSRNLLTHDCKRSPFIVIVLNIVVCIFFSIPYNLSVWKYADNMDMDVSGLLGVYRGQHPIVLITDALSNLDTNQVWTTAYLVALLLLSMGAIQPTVLMVEGALREVDVIRTMSTRSAVCLLCGVFFVLDVMLFAFPGGYFIQVGIDNYGTPFYCIVLAFVVVIAVKSLGVDRMLDIVVEVMAVPMRWSRWFWELSWRYVCPLYLVIIFTLQIKNLAVSPPQYKGSPLPAWVALIGVLLVAILFFLIVGEVFHEQRQARARRQDVFSPTERWRPGLLSPSELGLAQGDDAQKGGIGTAPSLMTRLYGNVSSRLLAQTASVPWHWPEEQTLVEESESGESQAVSK